MSEKFSSGTKIPKQSKTNKHTIYHKEKTLDQGQNNATLETILTQIQNE